jgi:hypothetical protein
MEQDACNEGNGTPVLNFWIFCTSEMTFSLSFVLNTLVTGYDVCDHPLGTGSMSIFSPKVQYHLHCDLQCRVIGRHSMHRTHL